MLIKEELNPEEEIFGYNLYGFGMSPFGEFAARVTRGSNGHEFF
jgi:hypothetical protein